MEYIDSPIIITANPITTNGFPTGATMKMAHIVVTCNGKQYDFSGESGNNQTYTCDISSALRAAMFDRNPLTEYTNGTIPTQTYTVKKRISYVLDGEYVEGGLTDVSTGSSSSFTQYTATYGALTELERYNNTSVGTTQRSTKPTTGERVPYGHTIVTPSSMGLCKFTVTKVAAANEGADAETRDPQITVNGYKLTYKNGRKVAEVNGRTILLEDSDEFVEFLFVNQRGIVEDACAVMRDALTHNHAERKQYSHRGATSSTPSVSLRSTRSAIRPTWKMSSGYCNRAWAEWWSGDFLASEWHYMKVNGQWLPVSIMPDGDDVSIYDEAEPNALHVDFTVKLALAGRL